MNRDQESFLNELLIDFRIEASEHYQTIVDGLIVLEKTQDPIIQKTEIEKIFREIHSLKGASRAVNLVGIEKLCMNLETVFSSLKKGESRLFPPLFDVLYKATDLLSLLLNDVYQNLPDKGNYNLTQICRNLEFAHRSSLKLKAENKVDQFILQEKDSDTDILEASTNPSELPNDDSVKSPNHPTIENQTVRISTEKLNSLLLQSEELISLKSTIDYFSNELQNLNYQHSLWNRKTNEWLHTLDNLHLDQDSIDFLSLDKQFRKKHEGELARINKEIAQFHGVTGKVIDELLHDIKTALLFPFSSILGVFPKLVRDLSKEYSKDIDIKIVGDSIEIDRRILEELKDPLIHLIRNCIDHGIETTNERLRKRKPPKGKIELKILQNIDRKIELHLSDDGSGLDKNKIIQAALKSGILSPAEIEKLTDKEVYALIFKSGISTSPIITTVSGRGLGMSIVAEKVAKLGGSIDFESQKDVGTEFILSLPQTITTFRGILVKTSEQQFIIPSYVFERVIRVKNTEISTVESRKSIRYNNETLAISFLSDVLKIPSAKKRNLSEDYFQTIILCFSQKKMAFVVDEIVGEHEGLVKDLGLQLSRVTNISGATILGSGRVVPILNPSELMDSVTQANSSLDYAYKTPGKSEDVIQKRILVAEDSITVRTLLRNFIESAGYFVKTTVDGMEAFEVIQHDSFDLIVSDVEMPRMNGFELTAKIRENSDHANLPVILVTALETAEDKQRGMEVGANAYITKSNFEKSNLIDTIQRLL